MRLRKHGKRCVRLWRNCRATDKIRNELRATMPRSNHMSSTTTNIESLQAEGRIFHPLAGFAENAHIKSMAELEALRAEGSADPEKFWARFAENELHWF